MKKIFLFSVGVAFGLIGGVLGFEVPAYEGRVTDAADILTAGEEIELDAKIQRFSDEHNVEVAILTLSNLDGYAIEEVGIEIAEAWKVGRDEIDSGIIVIAAMDERQWRIETGYGVEGDLPDILAYRLGQDILVPAFKKAEYADGFSQLVDSFSDVFAGVYDDYEISSNPDDIDPVLLLIFLGFISLFCAFILRAIFGENMNPRQAAANLGPLGTGALGIIMGGLSGGILLFFVMSAVRSMIMLASDISTSRRSPRDNRGGFVGGGWGGGSFGGGFSGFGGGSFGGGGASGSW